MHNLLLLTILSAVCLHISKACTDGHGNHPLVVISLDGLRAEYLTRGLTPTLQSLIERGVSAPNMYPIYPSETFPNHYTIATGLNPESHGLVSNYMCEDAYSECFSMGNTDPKWFGGDPFWNTVQNQVIPLISATMYWVGSDVQVNGQYPTIWSPYDGDTPFEDRIAQVLTWLDLPEIDRPSIIFTYFEEPDSTGHDFGPNDNRTNNKLQEVDSHIQSLVDGIEARNLTDCVNLVIVSDHGMTERELDDFFYIDTYINSTFLDSIGEFRFGAFPRIDIFNDSQEYKDDVANLLSCQESFMRQYERTELPKRHHYSNNRRIDDFILHINQSYVGLKISHNNSYDSLGTHGYDNLYDDMQAIFIGAGPSFKTNYTSEAFFNFELYNLMSDLLSVSPSPNNGTEGALYHLLVNPPAYPSIPPEPRPDAAEFPDDVELNNRLNISECQGDLSQPEGWIYDLNYTNAEKINLEASHLPFGLPYTGALPADLLLLYHDDHITGYSQTLKMPLWTSYTFDGAPPGTATADWSSDVRLDQTNTATCTSYDALQSQSISQAPLFSPVFSANAALDEIPYMISNAVPMSQDGRIRWSELLDDFILNWGSCWEVNVITGPLFDLNSDSLVDDFNNFTSTPQPPSDYFAIVTRCSVPLVSLQNCPPESLDALAFIYHQNWLASNCLTKEFYALMFTARVKDVGLATGLTFFTDLAYEDAVRLWIRVHTDIWSTDCSSLKQYKRVASI